MASAIVKTLYQASYGGATVQIHPIHVHLNTLACSIGGVVNAAPTTAQTNPISAQVSRNKRARGLHPRHVSLQAPATAPPVGFKAGGITRIPCLTPAFYAAAVAATTATTVTYAGGTFTVVGEPVDEIVR